MSDGPRFRRTARWLFGGVAVLVTAALLMHGSLWQRQHAISWPALVNMLGLLVLAVTGAIDPPPGRLRLALSALAIALIFLSALILLRQVAR